MIKDKQLLEQFERNLITEQKADYFKNLTILEGMLKEAMYLKAFPNERPTGRDRG